MTSNHIDDAPADKLATLLAELEPTHITIDNFSNQHARGNHTHYSVVLVTCHFGGMSKVKRHQLVYQIVGELLPIPIHALKLALFTPEEWKNVPQIAPAPACANAKK